MDEWKYEDLHAITLSWEDIPPTYCTLRLQLESLLTYSHAHVMHDTPTIIQRDLSALLRS